MHLNGLCGCKARAITLSISIRVILRIFRYWMRMFSASFGETSLITFPMGQAYLPAWSYISGSFDDWQEGFLCALNIIYVLGGFTEDGLMIIMHRKNGKGSFEKIQKIRGGYPSAKDSAFSGQVQPKGLLL